ncbi:aminotransferase class I/II-fold pyridoxal phosphate-dependent enzyme [Clostridium sp.]|uniref:aminotransferase class I/II-fold pyridoxal phosphate-dependent enzyme n=1 Tax=Clostridium sp. TaxID=1506 RepID=UPI003464C946
MLKTPIIDAIERYLGEKNSPFSMPGHKMGRGFLKYKNLNELLLRGDLTEVEGLDNLHSPEGAIKESLDLLKNLYGSKKSYFLVNGSTSGNLIMMFSAFKEGDKILVERNCHKSIFNGIILRKLNPVYVRSKINKEFNAPLTIDKEHFCYELKNNKDIKGIVLTYPSYYGTSVNLKEIIDLCKERNIKVLVDCAHGAHFGISDLIPENPLSLGADMVVMSAHKTLPSLTQTSFLHINNNSSIEDTDFYFSAFSSTSPSYPFMMSLDFARAYLNEYGKEEYERLIEQCNYIREKIDSLPFFKTLSGKNLKDKSIVIDPSRIVINLKDGFSGHRLLEYLRKNSIQCEMSDESNVILMPSPFNTKEELDSIYNVLEKCTIEDIKGKTKSIEVFNIPDLVIKPEEILTMEKISVDYREVEGKICGKNIVPYPPGIPLIIMGERFDSIIIDKLKELIEDNVTILGMENYKVWVLK